MRAQPLLVIVALSASRLIRLSLDEGEVARWRITPGSSRGRHLRTALE